LYECEDLASLRHVYLGSFILDPEDIKKLAVGASWSFGKGTGLHLSYRIWGTKGLFNGLGAWDPEGLEIKYSILFCGVEGS